MKYYAYCREDENISINEFQIAKQEEQIKEYCSKNNISISGWYIDKCDGSITDRKNLNRLLNVINKGDVIVVVDTSRLWRTDEAKIDIRRILSRKEVRVVGVKQYGNAISKKDPVLFLENATIELINQYLENKELYEKGLL